MMTDAIAGLFLLGTLATLLAVSAGMRHRTAQSFSDQRRAEAIAQEALASLSVNGEAKVGDEMAHVSVARTGKFIGGREWVDVKVAVNGRRAAIVGLAPATQPAGAK